MRKFLLHTTFLFLSFIVFMGCQNKNGQTKIKNTEVKKEMKDSNITKSEVTYVSGQDTIKAYLAIPNGTGPFPALIVVHEWWGLNDWIRKNSDEFADSGYAALAIDLYRGKSTSDPEEAHELMRGLPEDRAIRDLKAAFTYLQSRPDIEKNKIGSIGWCMGGGYSLQAALNIKDLNACVMNYSRLVTDDEIKKINCPVLGIFGEDDRGIPPGDVKKFEKALKDAGKNEKIIIYRNVGHAFINPNNKKGYSEEMAHRAWAETFKFLSKNLKD